MPTDEELDVDERENCLVCGLLQKARFTHLKWDICSCCGVQFAYEDWLPTGVQRYQKAWLARRAPWFERSERPENWDLKEQIQNAWLCRGESWDEVLTDLKNAPPKRLLPG